MAQFELTRLSRLESGKSDPGLPILKLLAQALGLRFFQQAP
jgi:transcriptional regulator with XRE-family HTH domain